ncbi:transposase [Leptospira koniambonensis]|uniref:transposase n=1 Tax=Leptospira koniambonensis TaxID=2484950 RepID=UPI003EBB9C5D
MKILVITTYIITPIHTNTVQCTESSSNSFPINVKYYQERTEFFLDTFYPKFCPVCNIQLRKKAGLRTYLIRCEKCHHQASRLSYTPLHQFKLPLWIFSYILEEAYLRSPKVLTSKEIQRKVGVSYKTALLLKRRIQLFAAEQKDNFRDLIFQNLESEFREFQLPESFPDASKSIAPAKGSKRKIARKSKSKKLAIKEAIKGKTIVNADTLVLFSASQRANKGRKRHKHGGCTASIYMSDKLGGKQIGTLVHTIATSKGALILDSVPDQKMNTLGPLFLRNIPSTAPIFTDSAYTWLNSVYRNHRMVNHSARSKDNRYRWARNRWSKDGVHIQYAEGNHRVIKQAFSSYGYIKPEYSQLYLNEYCFFKNLKVFGMEKLIERNRERLGIVERKVSEKSEVGYFCLQLESRSNSKDSLTSSASELKTKVPSYVPIVNSKLLPQYIIQKFA